MAYKVKDTGISEIYRPPERDPVIDIVFVHGLQGHPWKTWASKTEKHAKHEKSRRGIGDILSIFRSRRSNGDEKPGSHIQRKQKDSSETKELKESSIFWPDDILSLECPDARILTWGYDTLITKGFQGPADKSNIFAHGKKLLFALGRNRRQNRPIIFVAHSLGGIVVKDVLSLT